MQAVKDTLLEVAASPGHLGAQLGGVMVLHTWGQMLQLHPHVHVVVTFRYKDYARGGVWRSTTLSADEFLRRFLQHVVPPHFVRIRSFGFLASCHRERKLALIRRLLGVQASASACVTPSDEDPDGGPVQATPRCPYCGHHVLRPVGSTTRPSRRQLQALLRPLPLLDGL